MTQPAPWHPPTNGYDPRSSGADCDYCPMRRWAGETWTPVRGVFKPKAWGLLIGEAPAKNEEKIGKPFVGQSGQELDEALRAIDAPDYQTTSD